MNSLSDELAQLPIHLTRLALDKRQPTAQDIDRLADYVDLRTTFAIKSDPDQSLERSEYSGYLVREIGNKNVFVPYNLAPVFPREVVLREAKSVADAIAIDPSNPICISGSTTFLGRISTIGDLDYCEYHFSGTEVILASLLDKAQAGPPVVLVEVGCDGECRPRASEDLTSWAGRALTAGCGGSDLANPIKLDFVSETPTLGLLPSTSLVLPTAPDDPEGGNAERSFAFQEAVLERSPPRQLIAPAQLSAYLAWLYLQSKSLVDGTYKDPPADWPAKALKRTLSFFLAVGAQDELVDQVIAELEASELASVTLGLRRDWLLEMAASLDDECGAWLEAEIDQNLNHVPVLDSAAAEELISGAAGLAAVMVEEIEAILGFVEAGAA